MKISIFGLGYVGVVSAACLARHGHTIIGVDTMESKVRDLSEGHSPLQEPGVAELITTAHEEGRLFATVDAAVGMKGVEMVWICVGTPCEHNGGVDLSHLKNAMSQIGLGMRGTLPPLVVLRSTCLPGTTEQSLVPVLEETSGLRFRKDFQIVYHPEFLRESNAVEDFDHPPKIVLGESDSGAGDPLMKIYETFDAPKFRLSLQEAEMVKYWDNLFHAVKIAFANEMGEMTRVAGMDARRVAEVFCADTKLNISTKYLKPGFAFGGSCLPKDLRAVLRYGAVHDISMPMLKGVMESNASRIEDLVSRIMNRNPKIVGFLGLAFKPKTDDMRESPYVKVAKRLIGEGISVRIYDPFVDVEHLVGSNKKAVEAALGHLKALMVDIDGLNQTDLILVNHPATLEQIKKWLDGGIPVIDLVGVNLGETTPNGYEGIAW